MAGHAAGRSANQVQARPIWWRGVDVTARIAASRASSNTKEAFSTALLGSSSGGKPVMSHDRRVVAALAASKGVMPAAVKTASASAKAF